ncbi:MAG: M14 family metallocarboxypeptidase [Nanoarchaeota archaeon]
MEERSYEYFVNRLKSITHDYMNLNDIWKTNYGSIYYIHLKSKSENPIKIFLSAGVHGDEPAGVEAVIRFLEADNSSLLDYFEFYILPCLNPYGYARNVRWNSDGLDINRTFENNLSMEAVLVKTLLADKQFDLSIDFHEDWEYRGFYLFEISKDNSQLGKEIINKIACKCEIKKEERIDGFINNNGVIKLDCEEFGERVMALYLANNHVQHSITLETPTQWAFDKRVLTHLESLSIILENYIKTRQEIISA